MSTVKALIIKPSGMHDVVDIEPDLPHIQAVLDGGWLEGISPANDSGWHCYVDEEGKLKNLPPNPLATIVARLMGWPSGDILCGPAIFFGNHPEGDEADVPVQVVEVCMRVYFGQQQPSTEPPAEKGESG